MIKILFQFIVLFVVNVVFGASALVLAFVVAGTPLRLLNLLFALLGFFLAWRVYKDMISAAAQVDEYVKTLGEEIDLSIDFNKVTHGMMTKEEFMKKYPSDDGKDKCN